LHVGVLEFWSKLCRDLSHSPDVGLSELQLVGVDKASLDKGAGLSSTFAVVPLIDEAAVVAQVLVEITSCTREDLPEIVWTDIADISSDLVADLEDFAEDEDQTLAAVETEEGPDQAVVSRLFIQNLDGNGHGSRVRRIQVRDLAQSSGG
jgi:hypothetical protein